MLILFALIAGIGAGFLLRGRPVAVNAANKLSILLVYALLFLLGVAVGGDEAIVAALDSLGWQALLLSLGSSGGSVLLAIPLYRLGFQPHE